MLNSYEKVPNFYGFFEQENRFYIIQQFIDGENLAIELKKNGKFNQEQIIKILRELLLILQFVHQNNIIHRDIKPENIIRKFNNQDLYLVDFGASKLLTSADVTKTATVIGSAEYIAPEQARGKPVFASDIYSLGVTCVHLLTNRSIFDLIDLNNNWIWEQYLTEKIDKKLIKIINKMIAFPLNQRYQSVEYVIRDLDNLAQKLSPYAILIGVISTLSLTLFSFLKLPSPPENVISEPPIPAKESKSIKEREKEAIEGLMLLTNIQENFLIDKGEFLEKNIHLPFAKGHLFKTQKLDNQHIAIMAIAIEKDLRNFLVMIWGGKPDLPENMEKTKNYQPKNDDWGVLASPNISFKKSQLPQKTIRFNYCETEKPVNKFPNFSDLKLDDSLPLSYQELPCPTGYVYSLLFLEVMSSKSAETLPAIIYDIDGENLRIKP